MAQPTTNHPAPSQPQHDTPGVGKQGDPPKVAEAKKADPVLFEDIDPVLLVRLYPDAKSATEMRAEAEKAGKATRELGDKLIASQQEPLPGEEPQPGQPGAGVPKPGPGGMQPQPQPIPPPPAPPPTGSPRH